MSPSARNLGWHDDCLVNAIAARSAAIHDFIARDSKHYADLQIERLITCVERAAEITSTGHPVHEFPESGLGEVHEGGYRIIYGTQNDGFQVVTIIQMKQQSHRRRLR